VALPAIVVDARQRAEAAGFTLSSKPEVGALLSCLAATVPAEGRILELGTGVGSGLSWLVHGLGARTDVEIVTVEIDDALQTHTRSAPWPPYVRFELGDEATLIPALGAFDLIFADAPGGKTVGLESTIAALRAGGTLIVDDMDVTRHEDPELQQGLTRVRQELITDERLVCSVLAFSSGVIVAVRRW
jgi:demethylmenaquinone methyltransferase/2-methoxy-6-polyprenyl-1,4-benzoquinol methylase